MFKERLYCTKGPYGKEFVQIVCIVIIVCIFCIVKFGQNCKIWVINVKFGQNCEILSKLSNLVIIVKFHQNFEIWLDLSNFVWFGMALYGLVKILKLHVGSWRSSLGSGRVLRIMCGIVLRIVCGIVLRIVCGIVLRIVCGIWSGLVWFGRNCEAEFKTLYK